MSRQLPEYYRIARIASPHGVKGAVRLNLLGGSPESLTVSGSCWLLPAGDWQRRRSVTVELFGIDHALAYIEGVDTREAAEKLRGSVLAQSREHMPELEQDNYYVEDLRNCAVIDDKRGRIGTVTGSFAIPIYELLEVERSGMRPILIPFIASIVRRVDIERAEIEVNLPEGLWEVYDE
ncbi:MAG: 16S rRNA processing protein RimM [Clostridiaceae bacterium]|nr:16S rRNA processing protein RimM [Clostridiaceae bacterium]